MFIIYYISLMAADAIKYSFTESLDIKPSDTINTINKNFYIASAMISGLYLLAIIL